MKTLNQLAEEVRKAEAALAYLQQRSHSPASYRAARARLVAARTERDSAQDEADATPTANLSRITI